MADPKTDAVSEEVDMDLLTAGMGKYALVVGVAKRARELRDQMRGQPDAAPATAITRALEEIAAHKVRLREPEEDEVPDEESETEQE
jgi:DNA-directed RNA polymerase subunit K/omega